MAGAVPVHRDEHPGADRYLGAVDDHGAGAPEDGVHVLGAVLRVVVRDRLGAGRELDLVDPEARDTQRGADAPVVGARRRVRSGLGANVRGGDDAIAQRYRSVVAKPQPSSPAAQSVGPGVPGTVVTA